MGPLPEDSLPRRAIRDIGRIVRDTERDVIALGLVLDEMASFPELWHPDDVRLQRDLVRAAMEALREAEWIEGIQLGLAVDEVIASLAGRSSHEEQEGQSAQGNEIPEEERHLEAVR